MVKQAADLIFNPDSDNPLRLMLIRDKSSARTWNRRRVNRKGLSAENGQIEATYEWTDWSGGDGHTRTTNSMPGTQRPVTAEGRAEVRWAGRMTLPPSISTLTYGTALTADAAFVFEHAGYVWIAGGSKLHKIDPTTWTVSATTDLNGSDASAAAAGYAIFDGTAYLGVGLTNRMWKIPASGTPAQATVAGSKVRFLATGRDKLFMSTAATDVKSVAKGADPLDTANWSGALNVGSTGSTITALWVLGRILYIGRTDGPTALDTDLNTWYLIPEISAFSNATNCQNMRDWHGSMVFPTIRGTYLYVDGVTSPIGPERIVQNETGVRGRITAMCSDALWLYTALQTSGGSTHIVAAREGSQSDSEPIVWYHIATLTGAVNAMTVSTLNGNWLLVGEGTTKLNRIALPKDGGPPRMGDTYWGTVGEKSLPRLYLGQPGNADYLKSVEIDLENARAASTAQVQYRLDGASTWQNLSTPLTANGRTEIDFPTNTSCYEIELKVAFIHDGSVNPVAVRRLALNVAERPEKVAVTTYTVQVGDRIAGRNRVSLRGDLVKDMTTLESMADDPGSYVLLDQFGRTNRVVVTELSSAEIEQQQDDKIQVVGVNISVQTVPD